VYGAAVEGATLGEVWFDLVMAAVLCVLLVPLTALAGRRLELRIGAGRATTSARQG
jgi:hypothetical protein